MSKIKGGEFLRFIFCCWHNFTTFSINFQVLSNVLLSVANFGGAIASVKAPCNLEKIEVIFLCCVLLFLLLAAMMAPVNLGSAE